MIVEFLSTININRNTFAIKINIIHLEKEGYAFINYYLVVGELALM